MSVGRYHAGRYPAQEHVSEAERAAAALRPGLGTHAAALHGAAAAPPEQQRAARADPAAQPPVRPGADGGEPQRAGGATGDLHGWLW